MLSHLDKLYIDLLIDALEKRDLHPGNVLCRDYFQIVDLGLSVLESEASNINEIAGVMPYLAPELLSGRGSYSQATDIYAFGIIMWEINSTEKPFHEFNHDTQLALQIIQGRRPTITKDTPNFYRDLMEKCCKTDPKERPTAQGMHKLIASWYTDAYQHDFVKNIKDQIRKAEEIRRHNKGAEKEIQISHPGAIYTSRLFKNITKGNK